MSKEYYKKNRQKSIDYVVNWRKNNPDRVKELAANNYKKYNKRKKEESKKYYEKNKISRIKKSIEYYKNNKQVIEKRNKERAREVRLKVLIHYGKGRAACVECGYNIFDALDLDHINNNGAENRPKYGYSWGTFWRSLIKNNFPKGYQTLCRNCNWLKHINNLKNKKNAT